MNSFKKNFGIILYIISFGFLLICILGVLIIMDKLLTGDGSIGSTPIIRNHFMQYLLPEGRSCGIGDCFGPAWLRIPNSVYVMVSIITGLISRGVYKFGKKLRTNNEVISLN